MYRSGFAITISTPHCRINPIGELGTVTPVALLLSHLKWTAPMILAVGDRARAKRSRITPAAIHWICGCSGDPTDIARRMGKVERRDAEESPSVRQALSLVKHANMMNRRLRGPACMGRIVSLSSST